jgi:5-methylcytosine-specific restriction enzyme A
MIRRWPVIHHAICVLQRRSVHWPRVRKEHLRDNPTCAVCGGKKKLDVHHVEPFNVNHDRELDPFNLITLCMGAMRCHLVFGHLGFWKSWNVRVREMAKDFFALVKSMPISYAKPR